MRYIELKSRKMATEFLIDKIEFPTKSDVLRLHLTVKCFQKEVNLSSADINSLVELYEVGYSHQFLSNCVEKGYFQSEQTVRNAVNKMTKLGILTSSKRGERVINPEYLPEFKEDKLMFQYLVKNLA